MAIILAVSAAFLCGIASLFMRRSIDAGGSSKAYLVVQQALSFVVAILLNPVRTGEFSWNNSIALIGIIAGIVMGIMMWSIGRALETGPPGLSIAALNSSTVMPAVVMVILFGAAFGHIYYWWNALGSILVVIGLFWAVSKTTEGVERQKGWLFFGLLAFVLHTVFLVMIEWRALIIRPDLPASKLIPFLLESTQTQWFMPMIFLASTTILTFMYVKQERRIPNRLEVGYGFFGGICNGACTFFIIQAAAIATPWENVMVFPVFAVSLIIICNIWGAMLYQENVHWKANFLCLAGLFIGTADWAHLHF